MTKDERTEWIAAVARLSALIVKYKGKYLPAPDADLVLQLSMDSSCWGLSK